MRQQDVDAYMQFINHDAQTSYFYSVNRFSKYED